MFYGVTVLEGEAKMQGLKLTFQPASQAGLIDCNFDQSAE
jgi:hypothetical protein